MNETSFRRWLKEQLDGVPLTFVEPSLGSTTGAPDVWVPVPGSLFAPVELKVVNFGRSGRIVPVNLRAVQIGWHERMHRAGARSFMLLGHPGSTGWHAWMLTPCTRERLMGWQRGFALDTLAHVATDGTLEHAAWQQVLRGS